MEAIGDRMFIHTIMIILLSSVVLVSVEGNENCGSSLCKDWQVCESGLGGGTCFNRSSRIDCDGIFYCYKPRKCCGVSTCCPEHSECCGFNTCCPEGAVCCNPNYCCERGTTCCGFEQCCAEGSYCDGGMCKRNSGGPFRWWYIFFILAPLITIIGVIVRRWRRAAQLRAARAQGGVVVSVPVLVREDQYGYDQGPINYRLPHTDSANTQRPSEPNCPPPPYSEAANPKA